MTPKVFMEIKLRAFTKKKAKTYVSCCPDLDICTQGNTEQESKKNLIEAAKLFLISCLERGTLDAVLKQCGFQAVKKAIKAPANHRYITVPIPFDVKNPCSTECHG